MAISASTAWEVRTAGLDTNGGGFVTGAAGTDFSQQDAKNTVGSNISTVDAVAVGTGVITSATSAFTAAIVGNIIYLQGGTGALAAGWYQVTVFTNATTITVDRNVAAGTGITMNIGGALGSPGQVSANAVNGNLVHIKSGTYTITSAVGGVSGGCFISALNVHVEGYGTTRQDLGTPPLLLASGIATFTLFRSTDAEASTYNINVDGISAVSSRGFLVRGIAYKCGAMNCTLNGMIESTACTFVRCFATGCSTVSAFGGGTYYSCIAYNNTSTGFVVADLKNMAVRCISDSNSGATSDGFLFNQQSAILNCVAYNNGRDGFRTAEDCMFFSNCISESNGGFGFLINNDISCSINFCSTFGNVGGAISPGTGTGTRTFSNLTPASSVFTNAAGQDFSLNGTTGAALKATAYPGIFPVGGTSYMDIGALQTQAAAGGGPPYIIGG